MRYREVVEGDPRMNCDLCQDPMPIPGRSPARPRVRAGGTGALLHPDVLSRAG